MLLEVKNLKAGYGDIEVLRGVSIAINEGEIVALIGPNGAGKSTVLKSVMGLTTKTGGEILWKGNPISHFPTHSLLKLGIGFVPQGRLVFPSLTVRDNLEMGGYLIRHRETLEKNLEAILALFPILRKYASTRAGSLSGGEQQMLSIARALMMTPELLMLDEPSLGLSPKTCQELYEKLKELNASGTTLLIVEQNVRLVLRYAKRGYLLSNGAIRLSAESEKLGDPKVMHEAYLV